MSVASLPKLPAVTKISSRIIRVLGANPSSFTLQGTNSYLIGKEKDRWLIDTSNPGKEEYIENLRRTLVENNASISNILITHWHEDHIGAVPEVQNLCKKLSGVTPKAHKFPGGRSPNWSEDSNISDIVTLEDNQIIQVDGDTTLKVLFTPGHTSDHVSVVLEEENILLAGDIILGHGSAVFESLTEYMESLKRLQQLSPPWKQILSAHGAVIENGDEVIQTYILHREQRISQVSNTLKGSDDGMTIEEILDLVYPGLTEGLKLGAVNNIFHALQYLKDNGKVTVNDVTGTWKFFEGGKL